MNPTLSVTECLERLNPLGTVLTNSATGQRLANEDLLHIVDGWAVASSGGTTVGIPLDLGSDVVVSGTTFLRVLSNMAPVEKDPVTITRNDGAIKFKGSRTTAGIRCSEPTKESDALLASVGAKCSFEKAPEDFVGMVQACCLSALMDATNRLLSNVHITDNWMEACNDVEAARIRFKVKQPQFSDTILLPFHCVKALPPDFVPTEFAQVKNRLYLRSQKPKMTVVLGCATESDPYPALDSVFKPEGEEIVVTQGFSNAIERAGTLVEKFDRYVRVTLKPGLVRVRGTIENGWYSETRKCEYAGPELVFQVEPDILRRMVASGNLKLRISEKKMYVTAGNLQLVCALQKPEEPAETK